MNKDSKAFLFRLLETPSPTGFEQKIQRVVRDYIKPWANTIETDLHGNLVAGINIKARRKIMLAGHCDQIGLMIKHIDKDGFIYTSALGGIDAGVLPGARVFVHTDKGSIPGVIGRKPIHLQSAEDRRKMPLDMDNIWIDIGAKNKKEAERKVSLGDCVTFELNPRELMNDLICSPGLDDKVGLFVAMEALRLCAGSKISVALYAVSTVQEEVGLRGARTSAFGIDPEIGIAIDVTHASDNPGQEGAKAVPCKLGAGPAISRGPNINPVVEKLLSAAAKRLKIPSQTAPSSGLLGNDANAIQVSRAGVAAGSIGIPNRYMHTQAEVCSLHDIENAAKLLAGFVKGIGPKTDFRPV